MHKDITLHRVMRAVEADQNSGFCKNCGRKHYGCEPDARNYTCEHCKEHAVFGAEELLMEMA